MYKWVLGDTDADAIEQADIGLAFIIFGVFTLLVTVLMVNVLVAMFNKYDDSFHHLPPAASSTTDRGHVHRFIHLTQPAPQHVRARDEPGPIRDLICPHQTRP